jgi:hypothetical protein
MKIDDYFEDYLNHLISIVKSDSKEISKEDIIQAEKELSVL